MTVIIKTDRVFSAPNLPVMSNLIRSGLVLGLRPIQTSGVVDLSSSGAIMTPIGDPAMTDKGVRVGPLNHYLSNVQEPLNLTVIAGFRMTSGTSLSGTAQVIGSLRGSLSASDGSGMYAGLFSGSPQYLGLNYGASNGPSGSRSGMFSPSSVLATPATTNLTTKWTWVAITLNSGALSGKRFFSQSDGVGLVTSSAGTLSAGIPSRDRTALALGSQNDVSVDNRWRFEIAETLVYDRSLTDEEIFQQYDDSAAYMRSIGATIGS